MVHAWQCQGRSKKSVEGWIQVFVGYLMKERKIKKGESFLEIGSWAMRKSLLWSDCPKLF